MNGKRAKILIVDDDSSIRFVLSETLRLWNYETVSAANLAEARRLFHDEEPKVILLDIDLPDGSGLDFLTETKSEHSDVVVIMVTGNVDVKNSVAALRGGAYDFIDKPVNLEELRVTLRNAVEARRLRREVSQTRLEQSQKFDFERIIGESKTMKKAIDLARKVAESDVSAILLQGETGTGKDLFARAIHYASERRSAPYLAINCAALPANLIESELFGYEKGAFTDAKSRKEGLFEQAQGGTIFLDEIGELDIGLQSKLLRVLEENTFRRVGGLRDLPLDVRVVAASNRDLKAESEAQNFRLDLYYRLSVIRIDIPPLRERGEDVLILANHYIQKTNEKRRRDEKLKGLAPETVKIFLEYDWAGNVRELKNVIQRASILEENEYITEEFLPADLIKSKRSGNGNFASGSSQFLLPETGIRLETVELELAKQAMEKTNGNLTRAARLLNISRDQLRYLLKKSGEYKKKSSENQ